MDLETRRFINRFANAIRNTYDIETPIQDIREVVKTLGGDVEDIETFCFDDFYDGTIKKTGERSFLIRVSKQCKERENFTIAHEIGHLFLHMGYILLPEIWKEQDEVEFHRFGDSEEEYQAHEFAAALLMPKDEYIKKIKEYSSDGMIDIKEVARYFNVSIQAATNRGRFLGHIEW